MTQSRQFHPVYSFQKNSARLTQTLLACNRTAYISNVDYFMSNTYCIHTNKAIEK